MRRTPPRPAHEHVEGLVTRQLGEILQTVDRAAVDEIGPARARRASSSAPRSNIVFVRSSIRRSSTSIGTSRPISSAGWRMTSLHSRPSRGASEAPASASSSARTTRRRSFGWTSAAASGSRSASASCAASGAALRRSAPSARAPRATERAAGRARRGRLEVEAGPADDDGRPAFFEGAVDRCMRQLRVLPDRRLVVEVPDPDQLGRKIGLVREDRTPR